MRKGGGKKEQLFVEFAHCSTCGKSKSGTREEALAFATMHALMHKTIGWRPTAVKEVA